MPTPVEERVPPERGGAVTQGQELEWERCTRLTTSANRHALPNLRALSGLSAVRVPHPREAVPRFLPAAPDAGPAAGGRCGRSRRGLGLAGREPSGSEAGSGPRGSFAG